MKTQIIEQAQLDIISPENVEILVRQDGTVIWVNVDGICRLRICKIKPSTLIVNDERLDERL